MSERKLSILRALLARVQERTSKSRPAPIAAPPETPPAAVSASAPASLDEEEQPENEPVPPSAPRVREAAVESLDEEARTATRHTVAPEADEPREEEEEELEDEDMEITISDHPPPPEAPIEPVEIPRAASVQSFAAPAPAPGDEGLVLDNETPFPAMVAEAPPAPAAREDLSWPPAAPAQPEPVVPPPPSPPPSPPPQAYSSADEDTVPAVFPPRVRLAPPVEIAPPVERPPFAAAPTVEMPAVVPPTDLAPPEVTLADAKPEIHRPPVLQGPVGTFVEQSRSFSPRSFGELLQASLDLGRDA